MTSNEKEDLEIKVVLIGETGVGKTCIVKQATTGMFDDDRQTLSRNDSNVLSRCKSNNPCFFSC